MEPNELPEEYKPVSIWKFVGLMVLSTIPCVGIICTIVFACGAIKNKNIINYARAQLILLAIFVVLYLILMALGVGAGMLTAIAEGVA